MQRVDLIVDGQVRNTNQKSDLPAFQKRVTAAYQTAAKTVVRRHTNEPPPPPPPPPGPPLEQGRSWLVLAEQPKLALNAPAYYKFAVTADLGYRDWYADGSFFASAHSQGRVIAPWCDCRVDGTGTPPAVAFQMAADYHLSPPLGQGESSTEGTNAVKAGMKIIMGKIGEQTPEVQAKVAAGEVVWIEEDYWNCGAGPRDWHHLPVAGALIAVYHDADCAGKSLDDYIAAGRFVAHSDSVYGPGMTAQDYARLP
jgi:hypothetical protein